MSVEIRTLEKKDFDKGYFQLLRQLTLAPDVSREQFEQRLGELAQDYHIVVMEDHGNIIATGTLLVERKFLRGLSKVGLSKMWS